MKLANRSRRAGFTLVEVLIVVVILGILAATVLPQFTQASKDAKETSLVQNLQMIRHQISLFKFQHEGALPAQGTTNSTTFEEQLTKKTLLDGTVDATGAFGKSYRALAPLGRLVCFGLSGAATGLVPSRLAALGRIIRLPWFHPIKLMNDNKAVIGVNLGHLWDRIELLRGEMLALLADYEAGRIRPVVGKTFPLTEAPAAHRFIQERQNVGKVLLTAA